MPLILSELYIYEQQADDVGVNMLKYRGDNGIYKSKEVKEDLSRREKTLSIRRTSISDGLIINLNQ